MPARARYPGRRWGRIRVWLWPAFAVLGLGLARLFIGDYQVDTALYAGLAWHMVVEGSWWTPLAGDAVYFNKPPLGLWLHGLWFWLTQWAWERGSGGNGLGPPLWIIRLPIIAQGMLCCALSAVLARRLSGPKVGLLTGTMLALTFPFFLHLDRFVLDYLTLAGMLWATIAITDARRAGTTRALTRSAVIAGLAIGLAMLVKPFFAFLTLPIGVLWLALLGRWRAGAMVLGIGAAVAMIFAGPWHIAMLRGDHGEWFRHQYLGHEILDRAGGGEDSLITRDPWWSYFWFIAREFWPWLIGTLAAAWVLAGRAVKHGSLRSAAGRDWPAVLLCLLTLAVWLPPMALFDDKRPRYMMHLLPFLAWPAAIWLARWAPTSLRGPGTRRIGRLALAVLVLGAAAGVGLGIADRNKVGDDERVFTELTAIVRDSTEAPGTPGSPDGQSGGNPIVWNGTLYPPREARVYLESGVWPRPVFIPRKQRTGAPHRPREGDAVIWHIDRLDEIGLPRRPDRLAERPEVLGLTDRYAVIRWRPVFGERLGF